MNGDLHVWNLDTRRQMKTIHAHAGRIECLARIRGDDQWLTASSDGTAKEWNTSSWTCLRSHAVDSSLTGGSPGIHSVSCNADATLVALGSGMSRTLFEHPQKSATGTELLGSIPIDDLLMGNRWLTLAGPQAGKESVRFYPGQCLLASAARGTIGDQGSNCALVGSCRRRDSGHRVDRRIRNAGAWHFLLTEPASPRRRRTAWSASGTLPDPEWHALAGVTLLPGHCPALRQFFPGRETAARQSWSPRTDLAKPPLDRLGRVGETSPRAGRETEQRHLPAVVCGVLFCRWTVHCRGRYGDWEEGRNRTEQYPHSRSRLAARNAAGWAATTASRGESFFRPRARASWRQLVTSMAADRSSTSGSIPTRRGRFKLGSRTGPEIFGPRRFLRIEGSWRRTGIKSRSMSFRRCDSFPSFPWIWEDGPPPAFRRTAAFSPFLLTTEQSTFFGRRPPLAWERWSETATRRCRWRFLQTEAGSPWASMAARESISGTLRPGNA